jgi:hypothetical protein
MSPPDEAAVVRIRVPRTTTATHIAFRRIVVWWLAHRG